MSKNEDLLFTGDTTIFVARNGLDGKRTPTPPSVTEDLVSNKEFVNWGENNDFPKLLRDDAEKNTVIAPGLRLLSRILYGGGVVYGTYTVDEDGKRDWKYASNKTIDAWLKANRFPRQFFTILMDLSYYGNAFPTFVKSADGKIVARMATEASRALWTRLGRVNKYGEHEYVYINPDFGTSNEKEENTISRKCAPLYGTAEWIKSLKPGESFVYPIKTVDSGRQYYSIPDWNTARNAGWTAISVDIAKLNKAALINGMRPMWHIEVHQEFWPMKYGAETWKAYTAAEKVAKAKEFHDDLSKKLAGVENNGSYISTPLSHVKGFEHQPYSLVKITSLENKMALGKDGFYLTTSREAVQHQVVSMGLDSAMVGTMPGDGGMGSGSGSNARVNYNMRVLLSKSDQDMILEFMDVITEVNGWGEDLKWTIDQGLITTLDAGAEATQSAPASQQNTGVNG